MYTLSYSALKLSYKCFHRNTLICLLLLNSLQHLHLETSEPQLVVEPHREIDVLLSCIDEIEDLVDFELLLIQCQIPDNIRHLFHKAKLHRRHHFYIFHRTMVNRLSREKNGLQVLYSCLRKTQDINHEHKYVADCLEIRGESMRYSVNSYCM